MSVFDGEIDFKSMYTMDYGKKDKPKSPRRKPDDDNCLIIGLSRDALKPRDQPDKDVDILCPLKQEYYKEAVKRFKEDQPRVAKIYMSKELDPVPVEHDVQDRKRTEYLNNYCSRDLPFMSVNLARRARALQTLRLPDDIYIPDTSQRGHFRAPAPDKYKLQPGMRPKLDGKLQAELRRILRVTTGESAYMTTHSLLGKVILECNPFGPPRKEPRYGRWRTPYYYTYYMNI